MDDESACKKTPPAEMTAWERAAAEGIDMSLIEESLRKTPEQRIREHCYALKTLQLFEAARITHG